MDEDGEQSANVKWGQSLDPWRNNSTKREVLETPDGAAVNKSKYRLTKKKMVMIFGLNNEYVVYDGIRRHQVD